MSGAPPDRLSSPLSPGARLGPYEIVEQIGAGGMGEVYRAKDARLKRDVAVKVLSAEFAEDRRRLQRFEQEARAAGGLNHPNITVVYDIGAEGNRPYIVTELLEGQTLRAKLSRGPLSPRKAVELASQIAEALAAAHEKGIVHRDLKPENVFVTKDGHAKILDFGLAKLTQAERPSGDASTISETGTMLGTLGYMPPEQILGTPADRRSDVFAFGALLYEMLVGVPAFQGASRAEVVNRVLQEDPPDLYKSDARIPAGIMRIVARCLEKQPGNRFESIRDVGYALNAFAQSSDDARAALGLSAMDAGARPRSRLRAILVAAAGAAVLAGMFLLGDWARLARTSSPRFQQLTFRGAGISTARFTPDGQSVVFSSETEGRPPQLFTMRLDSPEVRTLDLPPAHILSISNKGEMALLLLRPFAVSPRIGDIADSQSQRDLFLLAGTLATTPLSGGQPRELLDDVLFADWAPNGSDLAVIHRNGNRSRVEFPIGNVIYDNEQMFMNHVRVSARDSRVAFKDWGALYLKEEKAPLRELGWGDESVWSDATGEIWYDIGDDLRAVTPDGKQRVVTTWPFGYVLYDISSDGRVLLGRHAESMSIRGSFPGETKDRDLSYFTSSVATDLSDDGDTLVFRDQGRYQDGDIYLRKTDGSTPKRLGAATVFSPGVLSPDGRLVLQPDGLGTGSVQVLLPTGAGQPARVSTQGVALIQSQWGRTGFLPDAKSVFFTGNEEGQRRRVWVQDLQGGKPRAVTPEDTDRPVLIGGGRSICARGPDFLWHLYAIDGKGEPQAVAGLLPGEEPIRSTPDGKWLYVRGADELRPGETLMTTRVFRLDPMTGQRELWKEILSSPSRDGGAIVNILFSADGKTCVWTHLRYSTELVLVSGLK